MHFTLASPNAQRFRNCQSAQNSCLLNSGRSASKTRGTWPAFQDLNDVVKTDIFYRQCNQCEDENKKNSKLFLTTKQMLASILRCCNPDNLAQRDHQPFGIGRGVMTLYSAVVSNHWDRHFQMQEYEFLVTESRLLDVGEQLLE